MNRIILQLSLLISPFLFISCNSEDNIDNEITEKFEVLVIGPGLDCGLWVIEFYEDDWSRIQKLTESANWARYFAYNLDQNYKQTGIELIVTVRKTRDNELHACTFLGPTYPWVTIVEAELKN